MVAEKRERRKNREQNNGTAIYMYMILRNNFPHMSVQMNSHNKELIINPLYVNESIVLCRRFNIAQSMFTAEINLNG